MSTESDPRRNAGAGMAPGDPLEALRLLSRLPLPHGAAPRRGAAAGWAWPLAGALIGALAALAGGAALWLGLGAGSAAACVLGAQILITGALHEDGLADCADGFWGGQDPRQRLEIMRDSRIGSYGTLALIVTLLLRWNLIATLLAHGAFAAFAPLVAAGALSRAPLVALLHLLPNARGDGLAAAFGQPARATVLLAAAWGLLPALLLSGPAALGAAVAVAGAAALAARIARAKIGGLNGDALGAAQQLCEIAALAAFAALLAG